MEKSHIIKLEELAVQMNTSLDTGISVREARERLEKEKKNDGGERFSLFVSTNRSYLKLMLSFFTSPGVILLLMISLMACLLGDSYASLIVLIITLAGGITTGVLSIRAQKKLDSMREYASPMACVKRGGKLLQTDGRNVVKGDIIYLYSGDILTADARLIYSKELTVKELFNTKKGVRNRMVEKTYCTEYTDADRASHPDISNMVYAGSVVVGGEGIAVVCETGREVYLAKYIKDGELSDCNADDFGTRALSPLLRRVIFIASAAILILSLISTVTMSSSSFSGGFLVLISALAMISHVTLELGYKTVLSSFAEMAARNKRSGKKKDTVAYVRDCKTAEGLTELTDVVLIGNAALSDGIFYLEECFAGVESFELAHADEVLRNRILTYIYTYVKALAESGARTELVLDGVADSLNAYIKNSKFDVKGADLVLKSLYFAKNTSGDGGYACAETAEGAYRVLLTTNDDILNFCRFSRNVNGRIYPISREISDKTEGFKKSALKKNGRCLYIISEMNGETVFEGAISLFEHSPLYVSESLRELRDMNVRVTVLHPNEDYHITEELSELFEGRIAYCSDFKLHDRDITSDFGEYRAYIGFSTSEFAALVRHMRDMGGKVSVYGVDSAFSDVMAEADISISSDNIKYSSSRHRESVYERLPSSGRDSNVRCSSHTRLKAKVLIHRASATGGGLAAISTVIRRARSAYVSYGQAVLFFSMIMCNLSVWAVMSVILGTEFLNSVQAVAIAAVGTILSMSVFSDSLPKKDAYTNIGLSFHEYPVRMLKSNLTDIIAKASYVLIFAIAVKVCDAISLFGEDATFTMPLFLGLLLQAAIDLLFIDFSQNIGGEGRRMVWLRFIIAYAVIFLISGVITQGVFLSEMFPHGIGTWEFILVPIYCILYISLNFALMLFRKFRK